MFYLTHRYVVLVSGLSLGRASDNLMDIQLMVDSITGQLGDEPQQEKAAQIVRVIIAGDSLSADTQDKDQLNKVSNGI